MIGRARRMTVRLLCLAAGVLLASVGALELAVLREPLPAALATTPEPSLRVLDRGGRLLAELRTDDHRLSAPVRLEELSPWVVPALLAAEDKRFYDHAGVDPLAMGRAGLQALAAWRPVSGASTITQQLARNLWERPRTVRGKLREMVIALRIERELEKDRILEEYLGRIEFGPNLVGIEAASRRYFDKPARALSLGEAAALAALPRGPTLYDPVRSPDRLERRRRRVLGRLRELELADVAAIDRALASSPLLASGERGSSPRHLVRALTRGPRRAELGTGERPALVETTLDAELQGSLEALLASERSRLSAYGASAAALVVLDNASGEVLAYVGSPDFFDDAALGQNDGVLAERQPGSTLKPFVYAAAMQELGVTAATRLADLELSLPSATGVYRPKNYDRRAHGPVLVREALASSLNVPAVGLLDRLGVERALLALKRAGFTTLERGAADYGLALALGDGEVQLSALARAYAMLARGGTLLPDRAVRAVVLGSGERWVAPRAAPVPVLDPRVAAIVTHVLADPAARAAGFGRGSALELPFPAAVKTGTSKGYRDNWAVGYTREVTVAVWVGNFDGSPMVRSSGVSGAGPIFRSAMLAAMRGRKPAPLFDARGLFEAEICALSGEPAGGACPHRVRELFVAGLGAVREATRGATCSFHEAVAIDPENDLRAGPGCPGAVARVFERYPPEYAIWAEEAGRPLAPRAFSARCPGSLQATSGRPSISYPLDGTRFHLDREGPPQEIVLEARAPAGHSLRFLIDGRATRRVESPFRLSWRLTPGAHRVEAEGGGTRSEPVFFQVD